MIYLTGATNDDAEPVFIAAGSGLMIQPRSAYRKRRDRYPYFAIDNGCLNQKTYVGDVKFLDFVDQHPRDRCLFVVIPDVARKPDGSLGGDPVATWAKFQELAPIVREMGFPVALAAQDGIETMPNVRDQIDECDCLFIAGSTAWKLGPGAALVASLARNAGKWVHMGRVNSKKRLAIARAMGCQSADGTCLKYRRRKRKTDTETNGLSQRGAGEITAWTKFLEDNPPLPLTRFEGPTLDIHRRAHLASDTHR